MPPWPHGAPDYVISAVAYGLEIAYRAGVGPPLGHSIAESPAGISMAGSWSGKADVVALCEPPAAALRANMSLMTSWRSRKAVRASARGALGKGAKLRRAARN
eukprot:6415666-Amphidinium_carterae.1